MDVINSGYNINHFIYVPGYHTGPKTILYNKEGVISPMRNGLQAK